MKNLILLLVAGFAANGLASGEEGYLDHGASHRIRAASTMQCVGVSSSSISDYASVTQWPCNNAEDQNWVFESHGDNLYVIKDANSGKCLDVTGWSTQPGTALIQYSCHAGANQMFEIQQVSELRYKIKNVNSGLCLEIKNYASDWAAPLVQAPCKDTPWVSDQLWVIE